MSKKGSRNSSTTGKSKGNASFGWLIPVAAVSAFVGFIVYLNSIDPDSTADQPALSAPEATPDPETREERGEPNFRFYDMLPESEVVTPDVEAYEPGPGMADRNLEYILQVGSFRSEGDAERQRAEVGFQGLQAYINEVSTNEGSVWYRVMVGPFDSRSEMNRAVDRLVAINIQPLVRQRTTESSEE